MRNDDARVPEKRGPVAEDVTFTDAISSSRMVSSLLKNHERNIEASRNFNRRTQERDDYLRSDSVIQSIDSMHISTDGTNMRRASSGVVDDWGGFSRGNLVRRGTYGGKTAVANGTTQLSKRSISTRHFMNSGASTPSDVESAVSSDIEVNGGLLCRKNALGMLFRNRGRSVQRAKEQLRRPAVEASEGSNAFLTPQKSITKMPSVATGVHTSVSTTQSPRLPEKTKSKTTLAEEQSKERITHSRDKMDMASDTATPGDRSRTNVEEIFYKIKRAVSHDLSDEIRPPLIHSFTNKIFAIRTPWQLPMKERSLRNNVQQLVSFFRVLERYVEDQVFRYGPALHPRLDRVYNELYVKVGQMFKRVSDNNMSQLEEPRRLAVVGNGVYDLGDHRPRGAPIYYQKFVIFDLSLENTNLAAEHGDIFHRQVLHFPMNSRGLPSMRYLCSVASAVLFWLDFYNRDNVVVFNYAALNYNMLLTFACSVVASQPLATANEIDQLIMNSFDWRRKCKTVTAKTSREKPDPTSPNDIPQMIPIARWPPSYKRYMSYFLSLYVTPIDFVLAQQFRLKRITLVNCMLPGTDVMLEVYQIGPEPSHATSTRRWESPERRAECSRYSPAFYPKCVCGGKDRDGVMLIACSADYQVLSRSTSSKSSKYGYVSEVVFDFKLDADGNRQNVVISGDVAIALVAVSMKQRKVIATYSFNTGFVSSESLEVPRAEFDIWDTSCAIQPHGQMTISMESRQRHSTDAWNTPNTPIVITPPMSDVGVFMRHHVAKVSANEIQGLVKATGLSSDTCEFALKLCPRYMDAMAMLNALFVPTSAKAEAATAVVTGPALGPSDLLTVDSVDTPKGDNEVYVARSGATPKEGVKGAIGVLTSSTDKDSASSSSGAASVGLRVDEVDRLLVDNDGAMQLLMMDGSMKPVPQNSITSLFQMFGAYQGHLQGAAMRDTLGKVFTTADGVPLVAPPPGDGLTKSVSTEAVPGSATATKSTAPPGPKVPTTSPPASDAPTTAPPAAVPPKSASADVAAPVDAKKPPTGPTATPPKTPPPPPTAKAPVSKTGPPAVKKGPPCKMKAPPPPVGLKAKSDIPRKPPPLGVKLHWKPLNTNTVKGTIFEHLPRPSVENKMFDSTVAKKLFSKTPVKRQETLKAPEVKRKLVLTILDPKRAQNVGIILRFPKESDFDELLECLDTLTLDNQLVNVDNIFKIQSALPQGPELESFTAAVQSGANFAEYRDVEQKIFKIIAKEHMEHKVKVAYFSLNYKSLLELVDNQLGVFERANKQVDSNEFLPIVMGGILQYGNFVNHGDDSTVKTVGFSLSSASKLIDIKSADNMLSSMHYLVVNLIVKFPDLDFSTFDKSLSHVIEAEKISANGIEEIFDEIRDGLNSLLRLEERVPPETVLHSKTKQIITESTEAIGVATERKTKVFDAMKNTWRYLGEECKQGNSLEEIFHILADFMRCIKRVTTDIQQRPSKFIVVLNADDEREVYNSKFSRARRN
ncbi:Formin-like protein [Babesia sp. Xinjiang]|uniref:Formin-like protein n=1 Tax=Babesia sp. Xinjiang TaxID=462227 RepID=UPI000A22D381|nr:Formin-like protein [Babesia sp. Xinjiang]ORM40331.1 Formin-like protein [Babesia sp. Xinjiang]